MRKQQWNGHRERRSYKAEYAAIGIAAGEPRVRRLVKVVVIPSIDEDSED